MAEWLPGWIEHFGYLGVGFLMFLETVFPPIPSELIMSIAGLEASKGALSLPGVIASGMAGAMLGNSFWYLFARALGLERFHPLINRWGRWLTLDWPEVLRAERWFAMHDAAFVCFGRMMPTIRSLVSIPAGFADMSFSRFLFWSTIGTTGWTTLLAVAGYKLGQNYADVDQYIGPVSFAVLGLLLLWYLFRVLTWKPKA